MKEEREDEKVTHPVVVRDADGTERVMECVLGTPLILRGYRRYLPSAEKQDKMRVYVEEQ